MESNFSSVLIFCDGACSGNPGPGGWGAIIATPEGKVCELGARHSLTTNNQMELTAAIRALEFVRSIPLEVIVHCDSTYVILGITQWIHGWKKRGWRSSEGKDILNRDLWEKLHVLVLARPKGGKVSWRYVRGHTGIPGNDRADAIAVSFSQNQRPELFNGPLLKYSIPIHDLPEDVEATPKLKPKTAKKTPAYSYLSLVGDIPYRHSTWPECERRVRGQSGAKFKKTHSAEDELEVLKSWGVNPKKLP